MFTISARRRRVRSVSTALGAISLVVSDQVPTAQSASGQRHRRLALNSTRFVGQRSCLFHAATSLVAEANASRGVMCPWRPMSHSVL